MEIVKEVVWHILDTPATDYSLPNSLTEVVQRTYFTLWRSLFSRYTKPIPYGSRL